MDKAIKEINLQKDKVRFQCQNKGGFDSSKFHWLYGVGDFADTDELLCTSLKTLTSTATSIDQAKGILRSQIRKYGGNAAYEFNVSKEEVVNFVRGVYKPALYTAKARAAVLVPKRLDSNAKEALKKRFALVTANEENSVKAAEEEKTSEDSLALVFFMALPFLIFFLYAYY